MDETVIEKVQLTSEPITPKLMGMIEPDQLEKRYGGTSPDRTQGFWPPRYANQAWEFEIRLRNINFNKN